jgi:hypothetical protein
MTFIHGYLLGGLLLAGVPVLLHLIMRQKPKRLPFPAFRFLKARQRTNQRKMRLQHLLLLLLRVLVIASLCLALARPRFVSGRSGLGGDRPISAVLLFDTSASMEYAVGGVSRLEDAVQRARELLDEMDPNSRLAVLDSGEEVQDLLLPRDEARSRLDGLRIRPGGGALNRPLDRALRLLAAEPGGEEGAPRFLYVFTDRTRACWDPAGLKPAVPEEVTVFVVDVGVETPRDLGIDKVEVVPAVVAPGAAFDVRVSVRGTPGGHENELSCQVESDAGPAAPDRKPVQLGKEQTGDVFAFPRVAPQRPAGGPLDWPCQVTVRLGTRDALPFNNARHATLLVRGGRKLLTLVEKDLATARVWKAAQDANRSFACEVQTLEQAGKLSDKDLAGYPVIALFEVADLPEEWARKLSANVRNGGALAIVPAGEELVPRKKDFNDRLKDLLPAPLDALADAPAGKPVLWERFSGGHPLMAPFVAWTRQVDPDFARDDLLPFVRRYWKLGKLAPDALSITAYAEADRSPALAERTSGKGRVVLFTTPLDFRTIDPAKRYAPLWTNYWPPNSSFGLVLIDRVSRYLGGEVAVPELNFRCGQTPQVRVPAPLEPPYTVSGPGLAGPERNLKPPADTLVAIPQAAAPGNYLVLDGKGQPVAGFSLDIAAAESDLERVPVEDLEAVLGKGAVLEVGRALTLSDAIGKLRPPPVELLPYLMMALLLILTLESLLANRFYRRTPEEEAEKLARSASEVYSQPEAPARSSQARSASKGTLSGGTP